MLGKLLKYDLKWIGKVVVVFYALGMFFAFLALLSKSDIYLISLVGKICAGISMSMVFSALFNSILRSWARFIQNIYKDEAYLTHTLPIKKDTIYLSKVVSSIIITIFSAIVIVFAILIAYNSNGVINKIKYIFEEKLAYVFIAFLEIIFIIMIGIVGIIIGYKMNNRKMLKAVLISFGIYIILSCVSLLLLALYSNIYNKYNSDDLIKIPESNSIPSSSSYFMIILYFVYDILLYFIGQKLFKKGVNVD